ncbi:MAG: UDP-3-O-(3-hydroxymyristoyl)glucosamine N-acyltransferase [Gemmatimonadaceae bacterium]
MTVPSSGELRLSEIASAVGGTVRGDPDVRLSGIAPLDRAGPSDLSFLGAPRYAKQLATCRAGGVLVTPELATTPGPCANRIVVAKPHEAMLTLLPRFYREPARPFVGVHPTAVVAPDAVIDADACVEAFAVVGAGARIAAKCWIGPHCVIGERARIGAQTQLFPDVTLYPGVVVGQRCVIHAGCRIGSDGFGYVHLKGAHVKIPHVGGCVIGNDVELGANCTIDRGSIDTTEIGDGTKLDNLVHVAHNVRIGKLCLLAAGVGVAGSARIGDGVVMAGQVGVSGHVTIGDGVTLTAQAGAVSDIPAGETWGGFPARPHREMLRNQAVVAKLPDIWKRLRRLIEREPDE